MSEERQCRNSVPTMCRHYADLGTSDASPVENLLHPIREVSILKMKQQQHDINLRRTRKKSESQMGLREVTCYSHQCGISALIPQTLFCAESAGCCAKWWGYEAA